MSDAASLAQAAATIAELRQELAESKAATARAKQEAAAAIGERDRARTDLEAERAARAHDRTAHAAALAAAEKRARDGDADQAKALAKVRKDLDDARQQAKADLLAAQAKAQQDLDDAERQAEAARQALIDRHDKQRRDLEAAKRGAEGERDSAQAERDKAQARVVELERLLGAPPPGTGVLAVHYVDATGIVVRKKYAAPDGTKFRLLPDAVRHAAVAGVMTDLGIDAARAEDLIDRRDTLRRHFDAADGNRAAARSDEVKAKA